MKRTILLAIIMMSVCIAAGATPITRVKAPRKITVEEIVAKHVQSIGPADAIAAIKSRVMVGDGRLSSKISQVHLLLDGPAQLASADNKVLFAMVFKTGEYPYEKAAFDGKDMTVGVPSGLHTLLAEYLRVQSSILKDGLFTGALSTAWPLLNLKANPKVKLQLAGTVKLENRDCYKVKYSSGRTRELEVIMYFDTETFRHVRTEYEYLVEPHVAFSSTDRTQERAEHYILTEDFGDFKVAGKLTLPFEYHINVTADRQITNGTNLTNLDWTVKIKQVYYDEPLTADVFRVS